MGMDRREEWGQKVLLVWKQHCASANTIKMRDTANADSAHPTTTEKERTHILIVILVCSLYRDHDVTLQGTFIAFRCSFVLLCGWTVWR